VFTNQVPAVSVTSGMLIQVNYTDVIWVAKVKQKGRVHKVVYWYIYFNIYLSITLLQYLKQKGRVDKVVYVF